jgi:hypothetical protein
VLVLIIGGFMIEWFESDANHWKEVTGKNIPKWKRSAGLDDDGTIFIPAMIASNEINVMMCAGFDGTEVVKYLDHLYVPSDWMAWHGLPLTPPIHGLA